MEAVSVIVSRSKRRIGVFSVIGVKRILEESAREEFPGYLEIFPELLARV